MQPSSEPRLVLHVAKPSGPKSAAQDEANCLSVAELNARGAAAP